VLKPPKRDIKWESVDVSVICGLGIDKLKKDYDIKGDCTIF